MKLFKQAQKYGSRALVAGGSALIGLSAHAQAAAADPITTALGAVDLAGVAVAIAAAALLIIGIALTFKGPDVAKRVIRKV